MKLTEFPPDYLEQMAAKGEGTYSAVRVSEMLVLTATRPEGIIAGALDHGRDGFVVAMPPFERDPGVWAVLMFKPAEEG